MPAKLKKLQDFLRNSGIGLALIFNNDSNFKYFNGCNDFYGVLVVEENKAFVLASLLELKTAKIESIIKPVYPVKKSAVSIIKMKTRGHKKIGINMDSMTVNHYKTLKKEFGKSTFADISAALNEMRAKKTRDELKIIKKACHITDEIFRNVENALGPEKTELDIVNFVRNEMKSMDVSEAFPTIVATGKNSTDIHHKATSKKLKGFTIIDIGVKYKSYCSDMTRTFYIGAPSKKEAENYNKVLEVMNNLKKVDDVKNARLLKNQIHSLGHSIGLEVHEKPRVDGKSRLSDGMILAIEPAGYYKNYGVRIEDINMVKNNKFIKLTRFPRQLIIKKDVVME